MEKSTGKFRIASEKSPFQWWNQQAREELLKMTFRKFFVLYRMNNCNPYKPDKITVPISNLCWYILKKEYKLDVDATGTK